MDRTVQIFFQVAAWSRVTGSTLSSRRLPRPGWTPGWPARSCSPAQRLARLPQVSPGTRTASSSSTSPTPASSQALGPASGRPWPSWGWAASAPRPRASTSAAQWLASSRCRLWPRSGSFLGTRETYARSEVSPRSLSGGRLWWRRPGTASFCPAGSRGQTRLWWPGQTVRATPSLTRRKRDSKSQRRATSGYPMSVGRTWVSSPARPRMKQGWPQYVLFSTHWPLLQQHIQTILEISCIRRINLSNP